MIIKKKIIEKYNFLREKAFYAISFFFISVFSYIFIIPFFFPFIVEEKLDIFSFFGIIFFFWLYFYLEKKYISIIYKFFKEEIIETILKQKFEKVSFSPFFINLSLLKNLIFYQKLTEKKLNNLYHFFIKILKFRNVF